jgi:LL-diaminopimelate aminotransferase
MRPSSRLDRIPPYLFAELERKIAAKRAAGIDVISLGIGDPDRPTYEAIVVAAQRAVADPSTQKYPSNRGRREFREAVAAFYQRRFGVTLDPDTEVMPAIGAKECIFNLNLAFLDPGDVALAADPGYPVYTGGPILVGGEPVLMPLVPEYSFAPDLSAISPVALDRARLMFLNYPNNPTGAILPDGLFAAVVELAGTGRRQKGRRDVAVVRGLAVCVVVHDQHIVARRELGVEVFSLSKGYNMTGWRCAAIVGNADAIDHYWRLKSNIDSGLFDAIQLAGATALSPELDDQVKAMNAIYRRRRDLVCGALTYAGVEVTPPKGTIYVWAPVPPGFESSASYCEHVLEHAAVVISPGRAFGPSGEGFFRISLTTPDDRLAEAVERLRAL